MAGILGDPMGLGDVQESGRLLAAINSAHETRNDVALSAVLEETCTMICVGGEMFVRSMDTTEYVHSLIQLIQHPNINIAVLAMRGIALMADSVPRACSAMVAMEAIPELLSLAKRKTFLLSNPNFAEELLKGLEILSLEAHKSMIQNNAVASLIGLTSVLKDRLRFSALCCVVNLVSAARPQDVNHIELSLPHLNGLLMEQLNADSKRGGKDVEITVKICACFAHMIDRIAVNDALFERLLAGEARSLVPNMVSVLQRADQSSNPPLLKRSAVGVLVAMYCTSPAIALKQFVLHHALQGVFSSLLDTVTAVEDKLNMETFFQDVSVSDAKERGPEQLPLLSEEQNCIVLLEFLLVVIPRATRSWDEHNVTLPHHGWQWEDDFHNHNEYEEDQARRLEEEYQRQRSSRKFKAFDIFQGARPFAVDFEHLRFLNSHGGLSRPFFRSAIPSGFIHRRALLLHEQCHCFRQDEEEKESNHSSEPASAAQNTEPGCFSKLMQCLCSSTTQTTATEEAAEKHPTRDVREERLLRESTRALFLQPEVMRLLLSTCLPSLLSLVSSVVNPTVVRHVTVLLLRCLSLSADFVERSPEVAPKAVEVLQSEAPTIIEVLSMVIRAISVEIGGKLTLPTIITRPVIRDSSSGEAHHFSFRHIPSVASTLSPQGETLMSAMSASCLVTELVGDRCGKLFSGQGLTFRLRGIITSLQQALEFCKEHPETDLPQLGGFAGALGFAAGLRQGLDDAEHRRPEANPSCPVHTARSKWITDALTLAHPLSRQLSTFAGTPTESSAGRAVMEALAHLGSVGHEEDHAARARDPQQQKLSCWEIMEETLQLLSNDDASLEDLHQHNNMLLPTLVKELKQEAIPGDSDWIPPQHSVTAHNFVANLCRRVGSYVDIPGLQHQDQSGPVSPRSRIRTTVGFTPYPLYTIEERLVKAMSFRLTQYTNAVGADSSADSSTVPQPPESIMIDGQVLNCVPVQGDLDDNILCLPFATVGQVEREVLSRVLPILADRFDSEPPSRVNSFEHAKGSTHNSATQPPLAQPRRPVASQGDFDTEDDVVVPVAQAVGRRSDAEVRMHVPMHHSHPAEEVAPPATRTDVQEEVVIPASDPVARSLFSNDARSGQSRVSSAASKGSHTSSSSSSARSSQLSTVGAIDGDDGTTTDLGDAYTLEDVWRQQRFFVVLFMGGMPLRTPSMTMLDALCLYSASALPLRRLLDCPPSAYKQLVSKALSIWLSQHNLQYVIVDRKPPPERRYQWGCSCRPGSAYYCTPMHYYVQAKERTENHVLRHCLELLHVLLPVLRRPGQLVPGAMRKLFSSVIHDVYSQSTTFLMPSFAPLGHGIIQNENIEANLATFALWNYPQVFPLSLRLAIFLLAMTTAHQIAVKASAQSSVFFQRSIVGAEWTVPQQNMTGHLFAFQHSFHTQLMVGGSSVPKKLKLIVSREKLLDEAMHIFEVHSTCPVPFDVEFKDEPGSGLGPTLEFFHMTSQKLRDHDGLWAPTQGDRSNLLPNYPLSSDQLKYFELLGALCGRALKERRLIDIRLHSLLWKAILGENLAVNAKVHMMARDPAMEAMLSSLLVMDDGELESAHLHWTLPGDDSVSLMENSAELPVTSSNVDKYVAAVRNHFLHEQLVAPVEAISRGLQRIFSPSHLRLFSAEELSFLLSGPKGRIWANPQQLAHDITCDHGYTINSRPVRFLIETVGKWDERLQRLFLLFISGSDCVPIGGLNPKITIVRKDVEDTPSPTRPSPQRTGDSPPVGNVLQGPDWDPAATSPGVTSPLEMTPGGSIVAPQDRALPTVNTCFHYLKLPEYTSAEILDKKLTLAMVEGQGSFALS